MKHHLDIGIIYFELTNSTSLLLRIFCRYIQAMPQFQRNARILCIVRDPIRTLQQRSHEGQIPGLPSPEPGCPAPPGLPGPGAGRPTPALGLPDSGGPHEGRDPSPFAQSCRFPSDGVEGRGHGSKDPVVSGDPRHPFTHRLEGSILAIPCEAVGKPTQSTGRPTKETRQHNRRGTCTHRRRPPTRIKGRPAPPQGRPAPSRPPGLPPVPSYLLAPSSYKRRPLHTCKTRRRKSSRVAK